MIKNIIPFIINSDGTKTAIYKPTLKARNTHTNIIQVIAPFDALTNISVTYSLKNSSADGHTEYMILTDLKGADVIPKSRPDYQLLADYNVWELTVSSVPLNGVVLNRSYLLDITFNVFDIISESLPKTVYFGTFGDLPDVLEEDTLYVNDRVNYFSARLGKRLFKNQSFKVIGNKIISADIVDVITNVEKENITVEPALLKELPKSVPPVGVDFNSLADKMYDLKHFREYETVNDFPRRGEERILYLAKFQEVIEGEVTKLEPIDALFKWDKDLNTYALISANEGARAINGKDGVGIEELYINEYGELVIEYSDGETINLGRVKGTDGTNGKDGIDGKDGVDGASAAIPMSSNEPEDKPSGSYWFKII